MRPWEEKIADFVEKYDEGSEHTEAEFEVFLEEGLRPMLEEYLVLKKAATDLAETNLQIFKTVITNPNHKIKHSKLYSALSAVMQLVSDPEKIQ